MLNVILISNTIAYNRDENYFAIKNSRERIYRKARTPFPRLKHYREAPRATYLLSRFFFCSSRRPTRTIYRNQTIVTRIDTRVFFSNDTTVSGLRSPVLRGHRRDILFRAINSVPWRNNRITRGTVAPVENHQIDRGGLHAPPPPLIQVLSPAWRKIGEKRIKCSLVSSLIATVVGYFTDSFLDH